MSAASTFQTAVQDLCPQTPCPAHAPLPCMSATLYDKNRTTAAGTATSPRELPSHDDVLAQPLPCASASAAPASSYADITREWQIQQQQLRRSLIEHDMVDIDSVTRVAGVDISFVKDSETDACAALVVLSLPSLTVLYERLERVVLTAPYIAGYLAFREVDFLVRLLDDLRTSKPELTPEVILVDGNGILHPNRFGLACHLGVLAGVPTVGVGKTLFHIDGLSTDRMRDLATLCCATPGDSAELVGTSGAVWGAVLRTTAGRAQDSQFKPVIVSAGHGLSLASATQLVWRCCKYRIPEPIRLADLRSREWLRANANDEHRPSREGHCRTASIPALAPGACTIASTGLAFNHDDPRPLMET